MRRKYLEYLEAFITFPHQDKLISQYIKKYHQSVDGVGIPFFIYRYLMPALCTSKAYFNTNKDYSIRIVPECLNLKHLKIIEHIFCHINSSSIKDNSIQIYIPINVFSKENNISVMLLKGMIEKISKTTVEIGLGNKYFTFAFFDTIFYDEDNGKIIIIFSKMLTFIFFSFSHFPIKTFINFFDDMDRNNIEDKSRIMHLCSMRFLVSYPFFISSDVSIKTLLKNLNFNSKNITNEYEVYTFFKDEKIASTLGISGIENKNKYYIRYNGKLYPKHINFSKDFATNIKEKKYFKLMENIIADINFSDSSKNKHSKTLFPEIKEKKIDKTQVPTVLPENYIQYALNLNISMEKIKLEFEKFKNYHIDNKTNKKDYLRAWQFWIRKYKNSYFSLEEIKLEKEFLDYALKYVEKAKAIVEFEKFKNYYFSKGETKIRNYLPLWKNWILNVTEYAKNSKTGHKLIQEKFYLAKLIDNEIRIVLKKMNITASEIFNGDVDIKEIDFETYPVPPYGKEKVTLFFWKDPQKQQEAINKWTKE